MQFYSKSELFRFFTISRMLGQHSCFDWFDKFIKYDTVIPDDIVRCCIWCDKNSKQDPNLDEAFKISDEEVKKYIERKRLCN